MYFVLTITYYNVVELWLRLIFGFKTLEFLRLLNDIWCIWENWDIWFEFNFYDYIRCLNGYLRHLSIICICIWIIGMSLVEKISLLKNKK